MDSHGHKHALPAGFRLGSCRVVRVLGVGGFGVTYLCQHTGLGVQVAVKEYLPNEIAVRDSAAVLPKSAGDRESFEWGLSRFLSEARTLARLEHPNVVRVRDCFEANSTAYIVMDYEDGESLDRLLHRLGTLTEAQLKRVVLPVAEGLREVHAAGFLHRDVKPSNIFVRRSDESPVLLDFGSARQALGRKSRSMTAIASAGYSPPELYESNGAQGPWTDIYALCALCYRAIVGKPPVEALHRQSLLLRSKDDPQPRLTRTVGGFSPALLDAVDRGLRVIETERPQSVSDWLARLNGSPSGEHGSRMTPRDDATRAERTRRTRPLWSRVWSGFRAVLRTGRDSDQPEEERAMPQRHALMVVPRRLVNGSYGLPVTFWLFGVGGTFLLGVVFVLAGANLPDYWLLASIGPFSTAVESSVSRAPEFAVSVFLYAAATKIGVWRAASAYRGPPVWGVLAKLVVLADIALATVMFIAAPAAAFR